MATGKPTHLGIKVVVIKPLAGQSQLPHHAMHDSIFACILEHRKKSPKHIAVRITLAWTSGCQVEVSRLFEELYRWRESGGHRDGEVGRFGLWICIGDSAPCRCQPPGHLLQKRRESLAAVLILPQRPAASYAKSRTTSAASRCTSRACILSPLHSVSLTPWNLPADTCLSRRCAFYLPF